MTGTPPRFPHLLTIVGKTPKLGKGLLLPLNIAANSQSTYPSHLQEHPVLHLLQFSQLKHRCTAVVISVALSYSSLCMAQPPLEQQRQQFVAAEKALQANQLERYYALSRELQNYPLYPYLVSQELSRRLKTANPDEVRAFLQRYGDIPATHRLRRAWLIQLANHQQWRDYLALQSTASHDSELECWRRHALLATGQTSAALQELSSLWLVAKAQPSACNAVFSAWQQQGGLTSALLWQRLRLSLDAGQISLAQQLLKQLPTSEHARAQRWISIAQNPRKVSDASLFPDHDPDAEQRRLFALYRLAKQDSVAADQLLQTVLPTTPNREWYELQRQIAIYLAARDAPQAHQRMGSLPASVHNDSLREWGVRLALRYSDWAGALTWLERMPSEQAQQPIWRYWRARCLERSGQLAPAQQLYHSLSAERDYYGFLAALQVHDQIPPPPQQPPRVDTTLVERLATQPAALRAQEWRALSRWSEARREWRELTLGLSAEQQRAAAQLAVQWDWPDRAIAALSNSRDFDWVEWRFPLFLPNVVQAAAQREGLDPAWIYAVIRQESLFQVDARSGAGALGLMQLLPGTAKLMAAELGERGSVRPLDAQANIRYGSRYLRHTRERLQNHPALATAAYNAGPLRVQEWLPARAMDADLWIELIPYAETRQYVQRVMEYTVVYQQRLGLALDLDGWLVAIQPN